MITSAGSPMHCSYVTTPKRYKLGGKRYCSYPELRKCHNPTMLPVDEAQIGTCQMNDLGLGKSIDRHKQLDEFAAFQDSQGTTRRAYCIFRWQLNWHLRAKWKRGVGIGIRSPGPELHDRYHRDELHSVIQGCRPLHILHALLLTAWGGLRLFVTIFLRVFIILAYWGCRVWILAVSWGSLFRLTVSPFGGSMGWLRKYERRWVWMLN